MLKPGKEESGEATRYEERKREEERGMKRV
jgi:hypothetical protein